MSWFSQLLHPQNPATAAQGYLNQVPGALGQGGMDLYNQIASGYKQSPGYQFRLNQGLKGIENAQLAHGMGGSPQHQLLSGEYAEGLANQDFENYLKNAMGLGGELGNNLSSQAQYGFAGSEFGQQQHSQLINQILAALGIGGGLYGHSQGWF